MQYDIEIRPRTMLYLGLGRVVQIGYHLNSRMHKQNTITLIFCNTPFSIRFNDEEWQTGQAVIINSNVPHEVIYPFEALVSFKIVPLRQRGILLQNYVLKNESFRLLSYKSVKPYLNQLLNFADENCTNEKVFDACEQVIDSLIGIKRLKNIIDHRIISVMNLIQKNIQQHISARDLAASVYLSEDRFLHLFKEQIGLPLRQYIIYQRIMFATNAFLNGLSISAAAQVAGFSDCAHFTRSFIESNGLKPSDVVKYQDTIYSHICKSTFCIHPLQLVSKEEHDCQDCRIFIS